MNKHYKYHLAIHILLIKGNKILLLKRYNTGYEDGKYSLIAGHVEKGESLTETAIREAWEEVGITITAIDVKICGSMHRRSEDERIDYFAVVKHWKGQEHICEPSKCNELIWCDIKELPNNTIPYIKTAIKNYCHHSDTIWYEEFGWNTYLYEEERRKDHILKSRGIIDGNNNWENVLKYIIQSVINIDTKIEKHNDILWQKRINDAIMHHKIILGTPILRNLNESNDCGLSACSVIEPPINKQGQILYKELSIILDMQLQLGIGIGIDLSHVKEPDKAVPKIDDILYKIDTRLQHEKRRPVAVILTLNDKHPRIKEFIRSREKKDFNKTRLNISIFVDESQKGIPLIEDIANAITISGEPGILFTNQLNKENATPQWQYQCTAPCAEIAMSSNDACHFSYLNLPMFVKKVEGKCIFDFEEFTKQVHLIVRFLDNIVEYSLGHSTASHFELVGKKRRIGIGISGFATALVLMQIPYNSKKGLRFAKKITEILIIHSKQESITLAKRRGAFPVFKDSNYNNKVWLKKKFSILKKDCTTLINDIIAYGIRNASTIAFPPTGTSSQLVGVSPSFEPYISFTVDFNNHRYIPQILYNAILENYGKEEGGVLIAEILREEVNIAKYPEFVNAYQIDINTQLAYTKIFQDASDGSASKTLNVPYSTQRDEIQKYLIKAHDMGLKGISIYRSSTYSTSYRNEC
ncbi:MAG: NUDIX domain-containing protein [Bacteroidaceae bacterium]|nr:NUDIX domain-containing protein [Bacteroidaceae bacterium]